MSLQIKNKKELKFVIMADLMMNRGKFRWSFVDRIKHIILPDYVMLYLKSLRYCQYHSCCQQFTPPYQSQPALKYFYKLQLLRLFHKLRYHKLGIKLGFSIGYQTLGYGVVIPHYGTIVIGTSNRLGNYAVLHTSTCISSNGKKIGDALYLSTGVKITSTVNLGDNISIGANSVVNKSFGSNVMIAGAPAVFKKNASPWYDLDPIYQVRRNMVEDMRMKMLGENRDLYENSAN